MTKLRYAGLDVHKDSIVIAVAEEGREEARDVGNSRPTLEPTRRSRADARQVEPRQPRDGSVMRSQPANIRLIHRRSTRSPPIPDLQAYELKSHNRDEAGIKSAFLELLHDFLIIQVRDSDDLLPQVENV